MFEQKCRSCRMYRVLVLITLTSLSFSTYAEEHFVTMLNKGKEGPMVFEPSVLKVEVGDTVTFIPTDPGHDSISVLTPENANTWHGKRGKKVSVVVNKAGVYIYKCAPHYYYGMFGVIHAGNLDNLEEAKDVARTHSKKFLVHENRLLGYLDRLR